MQKTGRKLSSLDKHLRDRYERFSSLTTAFATTRGTVRTRQLSIRIEVCSNGDNDIDELREFSQLSRFLHPGW
jgi:hypothetical protein